MCKLIDNRSSAIVQSIRVECNNGSKNFADEGKAMAYFDYMTALGHSVEMWLVLLYYDADGHLIKGLQKLVEVQSSEGSLSLFK